VGGRRVQLGQRVVVDGSVLGSDAVAAVAVSGEYEAAPRGPMVNWVKMELLLARRASSPDNGLRRGRGSLSAQVGGGNIHGRSLGIVRYWLVSWWVS
jgi:hypothetical protein